MAQGNVTINKIWKLDQLKMVGNVHMASIGEEFRVLDFTDPKILLLKGKGDNETDCFYYRLKDNVLTLDKQENKSLYKKKSFFKIEELNEDSLILNLFVKNKREFKEVLKLKYQNIE